MNNDLISREALKKAIMNDLGLGDEENGSDPEYMSGLRDCYNLIDNAPTVEPFEPDYVGAERLEEINKRLINEYISKVKCCDECFASVYCTVNRLRERRVPQDYCVDNIKRYFVDKANLAGSKEQKGGTE